jgi:hypothetical protein
LIVNLAILVISTSSTLKQAAKVDLEDFNNVEDLEVNLIKNFTNYIQVTSLIGSIPIESPLTFQVSFFSNVTGLVSLNFFGSDCLRQGISNDLPKFYLVLLLNTI